MKQLSALQLAISTAQEIHETTSLSSWAYPWASRTQWHKGRGNPADARWMAPVIRSGPVTGPTDFKSRSRIQGRSHSHREWPVSPALPYAAVHL